MLEEESPKNKPLKILVISEHYYPLKGGTVTYVNNLCENLAKLGMCVYLITSGTDNQNTQSLNRWDKAGLYYVHKLSIPKYLRKERYFPLFLIKEFSSIVDEIKPDIIHISHGFFAPVVIKISNIRKIPIIWTVHNVPPAEHIFQKFKNKKINSIFRHIYFKIASLFSSFCFRIYHYNKIICVSQSTADKVLSRGVSKDKICIIPNGISIPDNSYKKDILPKKTRSFIVLTVAGIIEHKGQLEVVKGISKVVEDYPDTRFIFVGPIRSPKYLESIIFTAKSLGVLNHIEITGEVTEEKLHEFYERCDVYVQPSYQEGFCITIMEAMGHGKPVIGTAVGAIPDLIKREQGILLTSPSPKLISEAVVFLLSNESKREEYGKNGKNFIINTYSAKVMASNTARLYEEILLGFHRNA
ncbi:MAG: glycosyltransferase family 4 protein [Methanoregula sp.]